MVSKLPIIWKQTVSEETNEGVSVEEETRHDSHLAPVLGRWTAPREGLLRICWSNGYSWSTAKKLKYALHVSRSSDGGEDVQGPEPDAPRPSHTSGQVE